jgi:uncharacterized protein YjbI with pentapeptide repeats
MRYQSFDNNLTVNKAKRTQVISAMTTQEPPEESAPSQFICDCEKDMRRACASEGFYKKKEGKRYCVLHYPGDEKAAVFQIALNKKQSVHDYNFRGVWFPKGVRFKELQWDRNTDFSSASFNEDTDFSGAAFNLQALFNNASFNAGVDFSRVIFSEGAEFNGASFGKNADFGKTTFSKDANFNAVSFSEKACFNSASFSGNTSFRSASFGAAADFTEASFSKEVYFTGASFSDTANFTIASFSTSPQFSGASFGAVAHFSVVRFTGANFINASFNAADFTEASFSDAALFGFTSFNDAADFSRASFSALAHFGSANFSAANFGEASFSADANFIHACFSAGTVFKSAKFKDNVCFEGQSNRRAFGEQTQLTFQSATFEKPDRVSFHTLDLRPHWFVDVDTRKFVFTDVEFNYDLKDGLKRLKKAGVGAPHRLLAIACRQLAVNAEENHRYRQASNFRYAAMDTGRLEWQQDRKIKKFQFLHWLYWIASGYGERVRRAFWILVAMWLLFALSYTKVGFEHKTIKSGNDQIPITAQEDTVGKPLPFKKVFTYSLGVMSLQKPEPKPVSIAAQTLVIFETILCPLQAALLALAIRRRFMR